MEKINRSLSDSSWLSSVWRIVQLAVRVYACHGSALCRTWTFGAAPELERFLGQRSLSDASQSAAHVWGASSLQGILSAEPALAGGCDLGHRPFRQSVLSSCAQSGGGCSIENQCERLRDLP